MALTSTEESLIRELIAQQSAILSLANNEATIQSKLGATKVTLSELPSSGSIAGTDLILTRQGTIDRSITTELLKDFAVQNALTKVYPVGSIYINASNNANPATLFGFGTWVEFGQGRVLVGRDSSDVLFDTLQETGGSKDSIVVSHSHTATVTDPGHSHSYTASVISTPQVGLTGDGYASPSRQTGVSTTGITVTNSTTGSSGTNANLQPYITVIMWKRTA